MADVSRIKKPIYMMGWPSAYGGANSERWHTLKMWRRCGLDITVVDSGIPQPDHDDWYANLAKIGCAVREPGPDEPPPGIVVSFCDSGFRSRAAALRAAGHRTVYVPCMLAPYREEKYGEPLADAYVFQSFYQRDRLLPVLGLPDGTYRVIRGAFDPSEFRHNPKVHYQGEPFIVGKIASHGYRTDPGPDGTHEAVARLDKWPASLWQQYARIPYFTKARVLGWNEAVEEKCGKPPAWAEVLPQGAETTQQFLESIHCLVPGMDCCPENWPRIGLEARAVGVPVIAEKKGGWDEMLGTNNREAVVESIDEQAFRVAAIAYGYDAPIGHNWGVDYEQERVARAWLELFEELST